MTQEIADILRTVERLAEAIANRGRPELWTVTQIARWWSVHENTVYREVVCRADFPRPVQVSETGVKRWVADEVVQWFLQHRAKSPKQRSKRLGRLTEVDGGQRLDVPVPADLAQTHGVHAG